MGKTVNWELIKAEKLGNALTVTEIAAKHGVSRQAIYERDRKEGWDQDQDMPNWARIAEYVHPGMPEKSKASRELLTGLLANIASGASEEFACMAAGISRATFYLWRRQSPELKEATQRARAYRIMRRQKNIDRAGDRGDWRASLEMLKRDPLTREMFRESSGGGSFTVNINVPRGDGVTIEGEFSDTGAV